MIIEGLINLVFEAVSLPLRLIANLLVTISGDLYLTPEQITSFFDLIARAFVFFPADVFLVIIGTGLVWLFVQTSVAVIKLIFTIISTVT
jgi:hypothetical protein